MAYYLCAVRESIAGHEVSTSFLANTNEDIAEYLDLIVKVWLGDGASLEGYRVYAWGEVTAWVDYFKEISEPTFNEIKNTLVELRPLPEEDTPARPLKPR